MNGEEVIIARAGEPVAILSPYVPVPVPRQPGQDAGQVEIAEDFDAPLPEFEQL
jgi:antitoxin (DNA-binding transcriptional repressor) of toxin-antitoxin stability system